LDDFDLGSSGYVSFMLSMFDGSTENRLIKSFPFLERSVTARSKRCQMKNLRPYQKWSTMALAQHRNAGLLPYRSCCHPARWVNDL
jgi:hypothetical protein